MKKKLNLKELKVQSFVTSVNTANVVGGAATGLAVCPLTETAQANCISNKIHSACETCGIVCHDDF